MTEACAHEIAEWTAANERAREAYRLQPIAPVCLVCECGRRTLNGSGVCRRCRE